MNKLVRTSHLMAKVRNVLNEKLHQVSTSVHKEMTRGSKSEHEKVVNRLIETLDSLMDPFPPDIKARNMNTGAVLDDKIVSGLLHSDGIGEKSLSRFIDERIKTVGASEFFCTHSKSENRYWATEGQKDVACSKRDERRKTGIWLVIRKILICRRSSSISIDINPIITCYARWKSTTVVKSYLQKS